MTLGKSRADITSLRPSTGCFASCKHESATCITVAVAERPSPSLPCQYDHCPCFPSTDSESRLPLSVTLRLNQSLFRVITRSRLCAMHAWHAAPLQDLPKGLLFIMPAQRPATSSCKALPICHCCSVLHSSPADIDEGGFGAAGVWAGPPKNASRRPHRQYPSSAGDRNKALICIVYLS